MYSRELEGHSLWAWTAAAASAPFAWALGSVTWVWTLGLGIGIFALWLLAAGRTRGRIPKWLAIPEWALLTVALSMAAQKCGDCWITAAHPGAFPLVLLALAACSAASGCRAGARCGAVLFWFVAGMFLLLGVFSVQEAELSNLAPRFTSPGERVIPFLLPGAAVLLPRKKGSTPWQWALLLLLTALGISVLTAGVLSPGVAENSEGAFFQMARGISILGVAERFEAVVAAALTLGWFCLMSLLLTAGGHMAETIKEGSGGWAVGASALIAWGLGYVGFAPNPLLLAGAMLLLWLIIPLITEKAPT